MKTQTIKNVRNNRGSSLIAALMALVVLGLAGMALVEMGASESSNSTNEIQTDQALYVGQAGIEYALQKIGMGQSPNVTNKSFGTGTFTITSDPVASLVTVASKVGPSKKIQTIHANFGHDCIHFDVSGAYTHNQDLFNVKLVKTCNTQVTLTKMWVDWNWSTCVKNAVDPYWDCPNNHTTDHNHGGSNLKMMAINGTDIYNPGLGKGTPGGGGADPNVTITVVPYSMGANGTYTFEGPPQPIRFSKKHPGWGLYFITAEFSDGSQTDVVFKDSAGEINTDYHVDKGVIHVHQPKWVYVDVLGSSITYGANGPEVPVRVQLGKIEDHSTTTMSWLFDGGDVDGGEAYNLESTDTDDYFTKGFADYASYHASYDSKNTTQVKTLTNGMQAPPLQGFGGQKPVMSFLQPYLNAQGKVVLEPQQVIQLYELGTTNMSSSAADFQDLVVLFTISDTPPPTPPTEAPDYVPPNTNESSPDNSFYGNFFDGLKKKGN